MNYHKIEQCNIGNGLGFRVVLWVSGCSHHCEGCQNPETWDYNSGKPFTSKQKEQIKQLLKLPYIRGITFSGGDPLAKNNEKEIYELCREIKQEFPQKDIWMYTGWYYEAVKNNPIMEYIDVLVDGPFHLKERDITLPFRGSTNQRIIDVQKTRRDNVICLLF